jgi:ABC-type phosphate/phosphonate transport system permease subunit
MKISFQEVDLMRPKEVWRRPPAVVDMVLAVFFIAVVPLLTHRLEWQPLLIGAGYAVCAFLYDGWAPLLTLLGASVCGWWVSTGIRSGDIESQIMEWITAVFFGAFVGLALGVAIDLDRKKPQL